MGRQRQHLTPAAATAAGLYPRTILRKQFRLKPATGQHAAATVWQGQGFYSVFEKAACVPLRPYRAPSPAQAQTLAAGRALAGTLVCKACSARVDRDWAERGVCFGCIQNAEAEAAAEREQQAENEVRGIATEWLAVSPLFLDTETTGLDGDDQVIELAILDAAGCVLFHAPIRPGVPIKPAAAVVNGINDADLASAAYWPSYHNQIAAILTGRLVIAHSAEFDARMLQQTAAAYGLPEIECTWECTKRLLARLNGGRWPRLGVAADLVGIKADGTQQHRATYDADLVRQIVVKLGLELMG